MVARDVSVSGTASRLVKYQQNIPEQCDDLELRAVLEAAAVPGVVSVKLVRNRNTGASRGHAYVEFASEADAAVLMDGKTRCGEGLPRGHIRHGRQLAMLNTRMSHCATRG